jgi:4-hydroxy-tetrahydrodipicolinate reductase
LTGDPKTALAGAEAIIDFTAPETSLALAKRAAKAGMVHVVGTTGFSAAQLNALKRAGTTARIVQSGNMSLGVNLLASLVERAAASLDGYDIEILELHHRMKVDAPSGTALLLGEAAAKGRNVKLDKARLAPRDGMTGARKRGAIGFASLRGGTVVGEHRVILAGEHERIELTHVAEDRSIFAQGALRAALWAADQKPGFYSIADVLGVK